MTRSSAPLTNIVDVKLQTGVEPHAHDVRSGSSICAWRERRYEVLNDPKIMLTIVNVPHRRTEMCF